MSTADRILELLAGDDSRAQGLELLRALDRPEVCNDIVRGIRFHPAVATGDGALGFRSRPVLTHHALRRWGDQDNPGLLLALLRADSPEAAEIRAQVEVITLTGRDAWLLPEAIDRLPGLSVVGLWPPGLAPGVLSDPALARLKRLHIQWRADTAPLLEALAGTAAPLVSLVVNEVEDLSALAAIPRIFLWADTLPRGLAVLADAPIERLVLRGGDQPMSFAELEALPHLRRLRINGGDVHLRALPNQLEQLCLSNGSVHGFEHLAAFSALRRVEISSGIAPTAAPLASFLPPELLALTIRCPQGTPQVLAEPGGLARLTALRSLKVSGDLDISALGHSAPPALRALWPSVSDSLASLAGLREAPLLEWISATRCTALSSLAGLEEHAHLVGGYFGNCGKLADLGALRSCSGLALVAVEQCRGALPSGLTAETFRTFGALWDQMRRCGWGPRVQGYDALDS